MTGVGGVGELHFRAPVMPLVETGFGTRSEAEETEEMEEEEAEKCGRVEGDDERSDVASDVCSPRDVEGAP